MLGLNMFYCNLVQWVRHIYDSIQVQFLAKNQVYPKNTQDMSKVVPRLSQFLGTKFGKDTFKNCIQNWT